MIPRIHFPVIDLSAPWLRPLKFTTIALAVYGVLVIRANLIAGPWYLSTHMDATATRIDRLPSSCVRFFCLHAWVRR